MFEESRFRSKWLSRYQVPKPTTPNPSRLSLNEWRSGTSREREMECPLSDAVPRWIGTSIDVIAPKL